MILLRAQWDRVLGWGLMVLGTLFVAVGAAEVRTAPTILDQLPFLMSGGVGGLIIAGIGGILLISAGLHDEWRRLHRLQVTLAEGTSAWVPVTANESRARVLRRWVMAEWDRILGWGLCAAAGVVFLIAQRGLAASFSASEQVAFLISGGFSGLFLVALAAFVLLRADLWDIDRKIVRIRDVVPDDTSSGGDHQPRVLLRQARRRVLVAVAVGAGAIIGGWSVAAGAARLEAASGGLVVAMTGVVFAVGELCVETLILRRSVASRVESLVPELTSRSDPVDISVADVREHRYPAPHRSGVTQ